ncbi:HalOD1 output domain-containing protein [Natrialba sp. PRR66]|uniref:HalOD1 output domain-containing protein n=1 Tax=Natrialba sp. PRR66 TaxID=3098146 RepID=UPI002B1D40CA|nr:HalOD1 output domain-containing protein [Natrialba sp. PRR66]
MSSPDDQSPPEFEGAVSLSQAIIEAIAAREGVAPTDIEPPAYDPLYAAINPEALDALFHSTGSGPDTTTDGAPSSSSQSTAPGHVRLEYEGYTVTVYSDGTVDLDEGVTADEDESVGAVDE